MARFLALDWDHSQLHLVAATTKHTTVQVQRALVLKEERVPNLATAEALGQHLREVLKAERIAAAPVLISVGRDRVILKEIAYPQVPASEEPAIVRFQALKELTHSPDEVVIDYFPAPDLGPNGEKRAQVLILRREMLMAYEALCKAAGLKLQGITPRPYGSATCLQRLAGTSLPPMEGAAALLTVADQWAEFCVVRDGNLLQARALTATAPGAEHALLGEIRRNLAVYAGQTPQHPVRALYLAEGGDRAALRELLQNTLAIPVHALDPFAGVQLTDLPSGPRGSFAGLLGIVHAQADQRGLPIDFLHPKEPKPERNPHKLQLIVGVAAAVLLLAVGASWGYSQIAALDRQIAALSRDKINMDGVLASLEEEDRRIKAIGEWADTEVVWLDELYDMTERFPSVESIRLTHWMGVPLQQASRGKSKHAGHITLKGVTTTQAQPLDSLIYRLAEDKDHYDVRLLKHSANSSGIERGRFPQQFDAAVDVIPRPPNEYSLHLNATAPKREPQNDGGFNPFNMELGGQMP